MTEGMVRKILVKLVSLLDCVCPMFVSVDAYKAIRNIARDMYTANVTNRYIMSIIEERMRGVVVSLQQIL